MTSGLASALILCTMQLALCGQVLSTGATSTFQGFQGYYFDLVASKNLVVQSFDIETDSVNLLPPDPTIHVEVWRVQGRGTAAGHQDRPQDWKLVGLSGPLSTTPTGTFLPLGLQMNEFIAAGESLGFYIVRTEMGYPIRGMNLLPAGTISASNGDLSIACQAGSNEDYFHGPGVPGTVPAMSLQVHYSLHPVNNHDLRIKRIVNPTQQSGLQVFGLEPLTVEVENVGSLPIQAGAAISWTATVDGGTAITEMEVLLQSIPAGGSHAFTFFSFINLFGIGAHQVDVSALLASDGFPGNDSLSVTVHNGGVGRITTLPHVEDFESTPQGARLALPFGWEQDWNDGNGLYSEWMLTRDHVSFCMEQDHTTGLPGVGAYAYVDDGSDNSEINLHSPCIDLANGAVNPALGLWWARDLSTSAAAQLYIDVIEYPVGGPPINLAGPFTHDAREWKYERVDLGSFVGKIIQVRFRVKDPFGGGAKDLGLDDVRIFDAIPTPGQNEQPGLAALRIADARNQNHEPQNALSGGPYFVSLNVGDPLLFEFEGQPNQPIVFLSGPLNPQAATFPNVGSMDIGFLPDPLTGIPGGLTVLADGTSLFGILSPFFVTNSSGRFYLSVTMPLAPPGPITTFQAAFLTDGTNGSWIALSNAIELSTN